jgi:hypothetical protein
MWSSFSFGSVTVILTESITFPRNVIICVGINTDFLLIT